jgi:hypothetical protein
MHDGRQTHNVVHRVALFDKDGCITHVVSQTDVIRWDGRKRGVAAVPGRPSSDPSMHGSVRPSTGQAARRRDRVGQPMLRLSTRLLRSRAGVQAFGLHEELRREPDRVHQLGRIHKTVGCVVEKTGSAQQSASVVGKMEEG